MRSTILKVNDVTKEYQGKLLFEHVNIEIGVGEHVALFGKNGVGKTTLLQGLLGKEEMDGGTIQRMLPLHEWGTLDQQLELETSVQTREFVQSGLKAWFAAKQRVEHIQELMQQESKNQTDAEDLFEQYEDAYAKFETMGGYESEVSMDTCMQRVRLDPAVWNQPYAELSGGQKTKAQLARILVGEPQFLLLDEPTNHLDAETLEWLEEWVASYAGTVLMVSHDRAFLDRVADAIIELTPQGTTRYTGGYTDYRRQKDIELQTQAALYKKQEQEKEQLLEVVRRYQQWFNTAERKAGTQTEVKITKSYYKARAMKNITRYHAKQKELERLEQNRVDKPREDTKIHVQFDASSLVSNTLLRMENVSFAYPSSTLLLEQVQLQVDRNHRIAVIGPNGAGKSTLLKLMIGELEPSLGSVKHHPQLRIGYFSQELENLDESGSILDSLLDLPNMTQTYARTILGCFLFSRDDVFKQIKDLSMGERCRVAFIKLYFSDAQMLVLDEPTNYLDIVTREKIEEAFREYPGAIVMVSHDRYLVSQLANRIVEIEKGHVRVFNGSYPEFTGYKKRLLEPQGKREDADRLQLLELALTQLMNTEEGSMDSTVLLSQIRQLKEEINQLKSTFS
ncbi:ABC transporter ATP-binding protein [Paenibacillus selenitireducens]|uniref:ABC transporter ATP-binding protein n=1 Tax=Paenibacillus selenitireducens TaxID=1324314 RepID=A0A1T2XCX9_9BACL|nr:ABC-F type ribosomal protection protein [Paenibacillus selenitireducens]OPA77695.1 ABC transporter ATP-binding protein [Paenibacillus selenitireducens]